MPRITTDQLLDRIANGDFNVLKLRGSQAGAFYMLLEGSDDSFIHESPDGNMKEYPQADHALTWLKRMTGVKEVVIDIERWQTDKTS